MTTSPFGLTEQCAHAPFGLEFGGRPRPTRGDIRVQTFAFNERIEKYLAFTFCFLKYNYLIYIHIGALQREAMR
jgi:hypothetical protein